ncbi:MAG: YncE family protein [Candidatus Acidiferrales bacterium]
MNHNTSDNRKSMLAKLAVIFSLAGAVSLAGFTRMNGNEPGASGYHVVKTIPIGGDGGWDYALVDADARRVYVSHATHVVVLDADSGAKLGDIPDTQGVHGIALAPELGRGYVSNGRANTVAIFDMKDLKTIATVSTGGQNPDAIYYDAATKRVFAFNGRSSNATVINGADGTVAGMIPVGGKPEFAAGAGDGHVFVNVEDKSEMLEIDAQKLTVLHRWPLAPCEEPSGLAMDTRNRRLFAVCDNKMMAVVNADTGKVVATPAIGDGPDAAGFDPGTQLAFSSNGGSGTLTVIHEDSPDKYTVVENVPTKKYARTMALDAKTHAIYLPIADFGDTTAPGERRPPMKPDTFGLLVVSK